MNDYNKYQAYYPGNNNLNFNLCNYNQQEIIPTSLYDPYAGFIRGNLFPDLYNQYGGNGPADVTPVNEQARMLTFLDSVSFAAHDLNLYLDNHPNNRAMIDLFNQYRIQSDNVKNQYETSYGPLTVNSDASATYPWAWNASPWPWENE